MDYEIRKQLKDEKLPIQGTVRKVKEANIFNNDYLSEIKLAFFTVNKDKVFVHQSNQIGMDNGSKYTDIRGFELGIRQDFIPLEDRQSYETATMHDSQKIQELFYSVGIPYEEFVVHELAHNVFDRAYVKTYGDFRVYGEQDPITADTKGIMTEVSDEYRAKIIYKLKELITESNLTLEVEKFFGDDQNNRQKIAEIFALMVHREFAFKTNSSYIPEHQAVNSRVQAFLKNPEKILAGYNNRTNRQITIEDFYKENHILSFIIVPLLENKFRTFKDRIKFLELNTAGLLAE